MSDKPHRRDTKSLVSSILAATPNTSAPDVAATSSDPTAGVAPEPDTAAVDTEARELMDVYFELEEPDERDVVFDKLTDLDSPLVDDFLHVMMTEDDDEYMRSAAAVELARRGVADAGEVLEADLNDPDEMYFFANAVDGLTYLRGPAFYDTLRALWQNREREVEERRYVMLCMESIDASRALADFVAFIDNQRDLAGMPDVELEAVIVAFARHHSLLGRAALLALRERAARDEGLDADSSKELCDMIQEGLDLIDTPDES